LIFGCLSRSGKSQANSQGLFPVPAVFWMGISD
jgi:hypothetical protein